MAFTKVIGAEVKFQLDDLIKDMIPFTGTMDRIVGDLDKKEVYIEDWKTGKFNDTEIEVFELSKDALPNVTDKKLAN